MITRVCWQGDLFFSLLIINTWVHLYTRQVTRCDLIVFITAIGSPPSLDVSNKCIKLRMRYNTSTINIIVHLERKCDNNTAS